MLRAWDLTSKGTPVPLVDWSAALFEAGYSSDNGVNIAVFSPDGRWLAAGAKNGALTVWDLADQGRGSKVMLLAPAKNPSERVPEVMSVAFSPNGRWFAAGLETGMVHLWRVPEQEPNWMPSSVLTFAASMVLSVAFSPDNRWLAAGGGSLGNGMGHGAVWDLSDPDFAASVALLGDDIRFSFETLTFSSNSRWLVAFNHDPLLAHLWPLQFDDLLVAAKRVAGRNMTKPEWRTALAGDQPYHATFSDLPTP